MGARIPRSKYCFFLRAVTGNPFHDSLKVTSDLLAIFDILKYITPVLAFRFTIHGILPGHADISKSPQKCISHVELGAHPTVV